MAGTTSSSIRPIGLVLAGMLLAACTQDESPAPETTTTAEPTPVEVEAQLDGRLVFGADGDVWSMNADGSDRVRLTEDPAEDFDPAWSPDGTKIAFRSHRDGDEEVYVMSADGSDERNLSQSPRTDYSPAWSPDGTKIAFASDRDGDPNEIYVMEADGSGQVRLTDNPGIDEYPTWSPDGHKIAFHCTMGRRNATGVGDFEICVVNADGSDLRRLTDTPGENTQPAWSPDGEWIAFESNRLGWPSLTSATPMGYDAGDFGDEEVWIMRPDGSEQRNLTRNPMEGESFPAWAPDGAWIVFTRLGALHVVSPDGDRTVPVANSPGTDIFPDWIA